MRISQHKKLLKYIYTLIAIGLMTSVHAQELFEFRDLPNLPPLSGQNVQPGLAGPFIGVDGGVLILAGGANFPDAAPWNGGIKTYHDNIYTLSKSTDGSFIWSVTDQKLPQKIGYGGSVATSQGLYVFGGRTSEGPGSKTYWIKYNAGDKEISILQGPDLPEPLAEFAVSVLGDYVYIMGGSRIDGSSSRHFWRFPIHATTSQKASWEVLPDLPGPPRSFAVAASQNDGNENCIYLFSGRNVTQDGDFELLYDGWTYHPWQKIWKKINAKDPFPLMAGTAFAHGASSIIFPSSADGEMITKEKSLKAALAEAEKNGESDLADSLKMAITNHLINHKGFKNNIRIFNTITGEISISGQLPQSGQVTTGAVYYEGGYVIPSGEIKPGVRTDRVIQIVPKSNKKTLSTPDILVIIIYFGILAYMGYYFSKRQKNVEDYFKGGNRVPWWAAGLSIFGTALSAITFMAIPAKTFSTDWSYFILNMTIFLVAPIIILLFIPFYRRLNITTAYEYLEKRFNLTIRLLGSASFILYQIGRMGVVLFLPSIALNVVTDIDIFTCIILMGVISMVYTMMGGIEAVIWTDVVQVIVLMGGAILCLTLILIEVGGPSEVISMAKMNDKFNIIDLTLSLKQPTVWVMLIGGLFANVTTYGTDQTMVQRYLTTKTEKMANKSIWTNAILTVPATIIFFSLGTAMFAFFKTYPAELNPSLTNNDALLPWYISSQLPSGVIGLLIAGIFAAAMSSLSSSINSAASAYVTDFHSRFGWTKTTSQLNTARTASIIIGTAGILFAILMATWDIKSLWDEFQKVLGLIIGGLGGVFLLGILGRHVTSSGALLGIIGSVITQIFVAYFNPVHLLLYSATGVLSCFIIGWITSYFIGKPPVENGLTYFGKK